MSLIATIFVLVFVTELISWIGKSVLLEFVSVVPMSYPLLFNNFCLMVKIRHMHHI